MPPDPQVHTGVSAIVHRPADGALLMVQRTGTALYADGRGSWCVPGGWLDFGETPRLAACREVLEETGVVVVAERDLGFVCNPSDDGARTIVTLMIGCRYVSNEPIVTEPEKCGRVEWDGRTLFLPLRLWIEGLL